MIVLKNVSYAYRKGHDILSDLSLSIGTGSVCGLLGRNGVGKSTMLYLMAGLLRPRTGSIDCNGHTPFRREVAFLNDICIVPEEFNLPPVSLAEYIKVNSRFYPRYSSETMEKLLKVFEIGADVNLGALSMGQKKKIMLSFAMACNTSVLLMDEPTNGLDISAKMAFRIALPLIMDESKTVLISTHQVHDVEQILDHVVIAANNEIILNASMADITSRLRFSNTNDPERISRSLFEIPVPGGHAVVEALEEFSDETDVNLECLFEMADKRRDLLRSIFTSVTENQKS